MSELMDSILKLDLNHGDVLFADANAVNINALAQADWPPETPDVRIVPAHCERGKSVQESIFWMSRKDAEDILKSLAEK